MTAHRRVPAHLGKWCIERKKASPNTTYRARHRLWAGKEKRKKKEISPFAGFQARALRYNRTDKPPRSLEIRRRYKRHSRSERLFLVFLYIRGYLRYVPIATRARGARRRPRFAIGKQLDRSNSIPVAPSSITAVMSIISPPPPPHRRPTVHTPWSGLTRSGDILKGQ